MYHSETGVRVERAPPEEVFALLGSELRVRVLRALAETPREAVSFSALRERVGEPDSGKFNYHLGQLTDVFVRRADEGGYELTMAGAQLVGALLAGTYTADATLAPVEMDDPCPVCEANALVAEYGDERAKLHCTACGEWSNRFSFPPGALDEFAPADLPVAFDRWMRTTFNAVVAGFCPTCGGRMDGDLRATPDDSEPARLHYTCRRCSDAATCSPATPALYHAGVLGFYYDHGVNVPETPSWRLKAATDVFDQRLVVDDPPAVDVVVSFGDDTATARVDATGTVVDFERSDR